MDTMLTGTEEAVAYLEELIVIGSNLDEVSAESNIIQDGLRPDPDNSEAIKQMPPPADVSSLCPFLGLMSHYSSFLPEMYRLRHPMNQLRKKDSKLFWSRGRKQAFEGVRTC
ncbi:unnamed protein product [Dibothriocephalus latus]|uniref:Uncharacterized protein n=1 Tax=Dibothriocephalus latus TaxID=60516 RepID=A0A3P7M471_DIBLA|nr:unnamed protein product [Dibothriocephalus latus]